MEVKDLRPILAPTPREPPCCVTTAGLAHLPLIEPLQEELKEAVQHIFWYWKVVRRFASERALSSSCLNWMHRLGFAFKRPKKRLLKADEAKREAFVAEYAVLREEAQRTEARIFFADEAHFRADAELRGKWVLKGQPALVDSTSPGMGRRPTTIQRCAWRPRRPRL